jgi:hypothetical protein
MRALCRLQIHANIFAPPVRISPPENTSLYSWPRSKLIGNSYDDEQAYRLFVGAMPPGEYQELGCVWSYLLTKYDPIIKKISNDLRDAMKIAQDQFFEMFSVTSVHHPR